MLLVEYAAVPASAGRAGRQGPRRHPAACAGHRAALDARLSAAGRPRSAAAPAHDPDFGVGDFPGACSTRARPTSAICSGCVSVSPGDRHMSDRDEPMSKSRTESRSPWLPRGSCDSVMRPHRPRVGAPGVWSPSRCGPPVRVACAGGRAADGAPLLALPLPGKARGSAPLLPPHAPKPRCAGHDLRRTNPQPPAACWSQRARVMGGHLRDRRGASLRLPSLSRAPI